MKAEILKLAGAKNDADLYNMFPTEAEFMAKYGKKLEKLKKAQDGNYIPGVGFSSDVKGISKITKKNNQNTGLGMLANQTGSIVGLSQSIADKYGRQSKELDQSNEMIGLAKKAAESAPKPPQQKYVRPEDQIIQPINPLGVQGFGYFQNGGEIQNTFAPNDIYTDMGYEPLNNSNPKQYGAGGVVADAAKSTGGFDPSSFMSAAGSLGGGLGSLMGGSDFEQTEEGQLASTILGAAGTAIGGPIGGLIGAGVGGLAGGIFGGNKNKEMKAKRQNQQNAMASLTGTANIQNMNQGSAYVRNGGHIPSYEDGGWMNPEYNPQVIAKFGDYDVNQLLAPPHDADMLRAGGHLKEYTPPSARAMYTGRDLPYQMANGGQMAMGGELQTLWGGGLETISRNPYDNSEIIMPKGQSHDESDGRGRTGIGIKYGNGGMSDYAEYGASDQDASVEVERNEPMVKMADGGNADNLVVFGNMIEDESKKKYKVLAKEIAKDNNKQTKIMQKAALNANDNDDDTVFGQFAKNTDRANTIGPDMKLKENSMTLKHYAAKQNAILDTAKEFGLESDALAKGKIKYAKPNDPYAEFGAKLEKAQIGANVRDLGNLATLYQQAVKTKNPEVVGKFQKAALTTLGKDEVKKITGSKNINKFVDGLFGPATNSLGKAISQKIQQRTSSTNAPDSNLELPPAEKLQEEGTLVQNWMPAESRSFIPGMSDVEMAAFREANKKKSGQTAPNWWETGTQFANSLIPYMRPSNQMQLSPQQLSGELFALSDNTLDPVYAQTFQPDYTQPVSISYQDQLNANQADFNALQRQFGYSPEVTSALAGQKYGANTKVLGEQSRANQAEQQRARETNRETANAAKLQNMNIFQNQADKMAQTKSIMEQKKIAALNSINDKYLKNQFENRQLAIGENMYNYRYSPNGVAYNVNPLANFAPYGSGQSSSEAINIPSGYEADDYMKTPDGKFIPKTLKLKKPNKTKSSNDTEYGRNGSIVKAIKNL
jgi:hypothetical protein